MLTLEQKRQGGLRSFIITAAALLMLCGGLYTLMLVSAPTVAPIVSQKSIDPKSLSAPKKDSNMLVIPKIGVNVSYGEGQAALDNGAQWRYPERGNPNDGGNFIIAAHRFTLAPTPQETVRKSPFYHIDKLVVGDKVLVDYDGKRYGYEISKIFRVMPDQIEIESPDTEDRLTLYSCGLGGAEDKREVLYGTPLGEVTVESKQPNSTS